ncbi:Nucleotide-bindingalpha-beta plait [Penicillium sp. IBT 31633x]|nr:Nucleotide-bindingalpha-beta plait [Penicillium sp. IBT 31633x]
MPFLGRDKPRARSRRSDDEFVVFLQGIPPHCRWQELKDLVRQTALHIRQAVVYDDSHGFPTGLGQIIVKNEDEAWRTYHRLSTNGWDGQSLVVTLSRTSTPTKPIAGPTRSPPAMIPSGYISGHSTPPIANGNTTLPPSPVSPESAHPATPKFSYPEYGVMMAPVPMPLQSFLPMMPDPLASPMQYFPPSPVMNGTIYESHWNMMPGYQMSPPQHMHPPSEEYPAPNHHPYHPRTKGIDPNSPSFYPDRRGLTLENLHTATTSADLQLLVQAAGTVQHCSILAPDPASNNGQARGLITMQTAEDAQRAVTMFNNMSFMGSRIRVKVNRGSHIKRNKSFDGVPSSGPGTHYSMISGVKSVNRQTCRSWADEMTAQAKAGDSCKPLVIDGSGLNKSVDIMSTPAPT